MSLVIGSSFELRAGGHEDRAERSRIRSSGGPSEPTGRPIGISESVTPVAGAKEEPAGRLSFDLDEQLAA